jgi:hypothetical protein
MRGHVETRVTGHGSRVTYIHENFYLLRHEPPPAHLLAYTREIIEHRVLESVARRMQVFVTRRELSYCIFYSRTRFVTFRENRLDWISEDLEYQYIMYSLLNIICIHFGLTVARTSWRYARISSSVSERTAFTESARCSTPAQKSGTFPSGVLRGGVVVVESIDLEN